MNGWPLFMNVLHTPIRCMNPFGQEQDIFASVNSYSIKHDLCFCLQCIVIPNVCVSGDYILNDSGISFLCKIWKYCICFIKFLLVFDYYLKFGLFYIIYILVGFNHLLICPSNGLGWIFTEISNL